MEHPKHKWIIFTSGYFLIQILTQLLQKYSEGNVTGHSGVFQALFEGFFQNSCLFFSIFAPFLFNNARFRLILLLANYGSKYDSKMCLYLICAAISYFKAFYSACLLFLVVLYIVLWCFFVFGCFVTNCFYQHKFWIIFISQENVKRNRFDGFWMNFDRWKYEKEPQCCMWCYFSLLFSLSNCSLFWFW